MPWATKLASELGERAGMSINSSCKTGFSERAYYLICIGAAHVVKMDHRLRIQNASRVSSFTLLTIEKMLLGNDIEALDLCSGGP